MRIINSLIATVFAGTALAGSVLAADPVRIGVLYPLSGPVAQPGRDVRLRPYDNARPKPGRVESKPVRR